jgi:hypothetical protein
MNENMIRDACVCLTKNKKRKKKTIENTNEKKMKNVGDV